MNANLILLYLQFVHIPSLSKNIQQTWLLLEKRHFSTLCEACTYETSQIQIHLEKEHF